MFIDHIKINLIYTKLAAFKVPKPSQEGNKRTYIVNDQSFLSFFILAEDVFRRFQSWFVKKPNQTKENNACWVCCGLISLTFPLGGYGASILPNLESLTLCSNDSSSTITIFKTFAHCDHLWG